MCCVHTETWRGFAWRCGLDYKGFPVFREDSIGCQWQVSAQAQTHLLRSWGSCVLKFTPGIPTWGCDISKVLFGVCWGLVLECGCPTDFLLVSLKKGKKKRTRLSPPTKRQHSLNLAPSNAHGCCALPTSKFAPDKHKSFLWGSKVEFYLPPGIQCCSLRRGNTPVGIFGKELGFLMNELWNKFQGSLGDRWGLPCLPQRQLHLSITHKSKRNT